MNFRRSSRWTKVALAAVAAIGVASIAGAQQAPAAGQGQAGAQGQGRGRDPNAGAPYTPATGAKDLRAVLFNWMWDQGMLKGHDERDMVASLEYQGKGTIQVDGQPCTLTKYRASTNYQTSSQRIQYTCTRANGQTYSNVEVVSGQYAWNEDTPGAEIGRNERQGRADAGGRAGATHPHLGESSGRAQGRVGREHRRRGRLGANPGTLFADGVAKAGRTSVAWEGAGKPVVTFPIPGVPGATGTATLDAKYMAERVVVTQGADDHASSPTATIKTGTTR